MKYIGIDYGAKRVGVSVSDEAGSIAFPRTVLSNDDALLAGLMTIIEAEKIERIVMGDTLSHGSLSNTVTAAAKKFADTLWQRAGIQVERGWEAGSSIEASRYAPEDTQHDDAAAAAIILQRFLDMRGDAIQ